MAKRYTPGPRILELPRLPRIRLSKKAWHTLIVIMSVILLIMIFLYLFPGGTKNCGTDESCFISSAYACQPAKFNNLVGTTEVNYLIEDDCTVIKTITRMGAKEPQQVRNLFLGLSMKCSYKKGLFSQDYIKKLDGKIDTCFGPLATVINDLRK